MARLDYKAISEAADMRDVLAALGIEEYHGKALCPFHDDRNPSMQIYADGYHCFVCGAHGDAIDLVQHVRGCSRAEAARSVAYIAGTGIIEAGIETQHRESERKRREREYEADIQRLADIDDAIAETRNACYNASPYTEMWTALYRRLDQLLNEREAVDERILTESLRRYTEKHGRNRDQKRYNSKVLRSGGVCTDRGNKQRI